MLAVIVVGRFTTLPARPQRSLPRFEYDLTIPLLQSSHIKATLVPNHRYRVEMDPGDLGVRWWNYVGKHEENVDLEPRASDDSSLPPSSEPVARLVGRTPHHRDFLVIDSLPKPPRISITMSLTSSSSDVVHKSKPSPLIIRATITNHGDRTITVQSERDQNFISVYDLKQGAAAAYGIPNHRRITATKKGSPQSVANFSIVETAPKTGTGLETGTGTDLIGKPRFTCSLPASGGSQGRYGRDRL